MIITKNETKYDTRKLKTVITAVYNAEAKKRGPLRVWKRTRVEVITSRKWYSGRAHLSGLWMLLRVPSDTTVDLHRFVALIRHEVWHLYGIQHEDFTPSVMHCEHTDFVKDIVQSLGPDFMVGVKEVKTKAKPTKVEALDTRMANLATRLKAWETKRKRAENAIAKITKEQKKVTKKLTEATA